MADFNEWVTGFGQDTWNANVREFTTSDDPNQLASFRNLIMIFYVRDTVVKASSMFCFGVYVALNI